MPFQKGHKLATGRPVGSKDKAKMELKRVVAQFVEDNSVKFQGWLDDIQESDGSLEAFKRVEALLEYCLPKLARSEITGKDGETLSVTIKQISPVKDK